MQRMKTSLSTFAAGLLATICQLITLGFPSAESYEGYRGRVTQHGLNYASQVGVEVLMKYLPVTDIPDLREQMGGMAVVLTNISVLDFQRPTLDLDLTPNTETSFGGLRAVFSLLDPTIECHMKMTYEWGFFSTTRELFVTIATSNLSVALNGSIGVDVEGNGLIGGFTCQIEGNVQIASKTEESGAFSGLFDFVASNFNERLKEIIFAKACHNITVFVNTSVQSHLSSVNMSRSVLDEDLLFNLKFAKSPKVTNNYFESSHVGEMFLTNDTFHTQRLIRAPTIIPAFPDLSPRMMYAFITDRCANSIWEAAARSNKLRFTAKPSTLRISKVLRRYLRTSCSSGSQCIGKIFPQLKSFYRQKLVQLDMEARPSQTQYFRFRGRMVQFQIPTTAEFYAETRKSRDLLISISSVWSGSFILSARGGQAFFNFTKLSISTNDSRTHREELLVPSNSQLKEFAKSFNRRFLLPFLKEFCSKGYPIEIPTLPWLKFLNPEIINTRNQNLIVLGTDVKLDVESMPDLLG